MASPARSLSDNTIKLEYGVSETLCFRFIEGKNLGKSEFPPFAIRVRFSTQDDRSLFLDAEDASDLERGLRNAGVDPRQGDFVRVTKIRHPRGGGHSIRVERVEDEADQSGSSRVEPGRDGSSRRETYHAPPSPPSPQSRRGPSRQEDSRRQQPRPQSQMEAKLEKSIDLAREHGPAAFHAPKPSQANPEADPRQDAPPFLAMYKSAIDTLIAARAYAQSKGMAIEIRCEDVRCLAATLIIGANGGGR